MGLYLLPSHLQSSAGHTVTPNHDTQVSTHKSPHIYCHLQRVISSSPQQFSVLQLPSYGRPWGPSLLLHASCNQSITRAVQGRDGRRFIETLLTCKAGAPIQLSLGRYWQQQLTATKAPTRCGHFSTTPNAATEKRRLQSMYIVRVANTVSRSTNANDVIRGAVYSLDEAFFIFRVPHGATVHA